MKRVAVLIRWIMFQIIKISTSSLSDMTKKAFKFINLEALKRIKFQTIFEKKILKAFTADSSQHFIMPFVFLNCG